VKVDFNILGLPAFSVGLPAFLVGVPRQLSGRALRSKLFSLKNSQKDGFTLSGVEGQSLTQLVVKNKLKINKQIRKYF